MMRTEPRHNVSRNHSKFEKTSAVRSEGSTVKLLDMRHEPGPVMTGQACRSGRAWT
jgi:hypothetical protein